MQYKKNQTDTNILYLKGIESLLKTLDSEKTVYFLSEFGFELATEKQFTFAIAKMIPDSVKYDVLMNNIRDLVKKIPDDEQLIRNPLARLFGERFESLIKKIHNFSLFVEILLPFPSLPRETTARNRNRYNKSYF